MRFTRAKALVVFTLSLHAFTLSVLGLLVTRVATVHTQQRDDSEHLAAQREQLQALQHQLATHAEALQSAAARTLDPERIAALAKDAVFVLDIGGGSGTGFAIHRSGDITTLLTNAHVVASVGEGEALTVKDGEEEFEGIVTEISSVHDAALVELQGFRVPVLSYDIARPAIGTGVAVVGAPLGIDDTVTTGVISGFYDDHLQLSAPISPGSSGSPVLNAAGAVIGIVSSKYAGLGVEGVSFAVPMAAICDIFPHVCERNGK